MHGTTDCEDSKSVLDGDINLLLLTACLNIEILQWMTSSNFMGTTADLQELGPALGFHDLHK